MKHEKNSKNFLVSQKSQRDFLRCPICQSNNTRKDSKRRTSTGYKQRWYCKDCHKRFTETPTPHIKGDENTVILAIDLYLKGVSYRGIADSLKQFYGLKVSHITVMNWINKFMKIINEYVKNLHPEVVINGMQMNNSLK